MTQTGSYLTATATIPPTWPVMILDPGTGELVPGGLTACHTGLPITALTTCTEPMTVGQTRTLAAGLPETGFILTSSRSGYEHTEFVIEPGRQRVIIGGWDWVTRTYIPRQDDHAGPRLTAGPVNIHTYFGLSYSSYLVLHRTLLQSMPEDWQHRFTGMLVEYDTAFRHVPQSIVYAVEAVTECEVSELTPDQLQAEGITTEDGPCDRDRITVADDPGARLHEHTDNDGADCIPRIIYTDSTGRELRPGEPVLITIPDPVPPYSRGRTRIEPRIGGN